MFDKHRVNGSNPFKPMKMVLNGGYYFEIFFLALNFIVILIFFFFKLKNINKYFLISNIFIIISLFCITLYNKPHNLDSIVKSLIFNKNIINSNDFSQI